MLLFFSSFFNKTMIMLKYKERKNDTKEESRRKKVNLIWPDDDGLNIVISQYTIF